MGEIHPIELRSYEIMEAELGPVLSAWPRPERAVVARMVHATADESFARSALIGAGAVEAALGALLSGAAIICDARMVVAGIPSRPALCYLDRVTPTTGPVTGPVTTAGTGPVTAPVTGPVTRAGTGRPVTGAVTGTEPVTAPVTGETRSAAAVESAAAEHPEGALWVFGNAPTALRRLMDLHAAGRVRPAAVIGLPVGYVGAAEAKAELWASPLGPVSITNSGRRGGSPVAAAAVNALLRLLP